MMNFERRIKNVQKILGRKRIDALYISNIKNIRYLTGFTGSAGFVIITRNNSLFYTDFRYKEQAGAEVRACEIGIEKGKRIKTLCILIEKLGISRIGFESTVSYEFYNNFKKLFATLIPQANIIENLRKIKDKEEVDNIKEAVKRAEKAFIKVKPKIKAGARERELALRIEDALKKAGCRTAPFDIIVASGKNSAMPHARPTLKKIEKGDFVIIDWGGEANGYYSDMTRTLLLSGKADSEKIKIYKTVNKARKHAIEIVRSGIKTVEVDNAARMIIKKAGYGDFFGHGTGHGVGLDVHESPRVSWDQSEKICEGMVFTVEPGVYIPNFGGVRIEDMVTVGPDKAEVLTNLGREMEIIK